MTDDGIDWVSQGFSPGGHELPQEFVSPTAEAVGHPTNHVGFNERSFEHKYFGRAGRIHTLLPL